MSTYRSSGWFTIRIMCLSRVDMSTYRSSGWNTIRIMCLSRHVYLQKFWLAHNQDNVSVGRHVYLQKFWLVHNQDNVSVGNMSTYRSSGWSTIRIMCL